ncbi:MAG: DUF929 family protein [Ktedonobacterales bacterium]
MSNRTSACLTWLHVRPRRAQPPGAALMLAVLSSAILAACAGTTAGGGYGNTPGSNRPQPTSTSIIYTVTNVNPAVIAAIGMGGIQNPIVAVPSSAAGGPLVSNGKPAILYIGAGYSPYSAAERWSIIVALSRFGTFSILRLTTSSNTDVYPNTPTFTFYGTSYASAYLDFQSVELTGQDQNATLQTPTNAQQNLMSIYDSSQYVGSGLAGGIPFIDFGNQYVVVSSGFSPQLLSGQTQQGIASRLSNANDPITQAIVGNANWLTAAICKLTNNQPGSICTAGPIPQIEAQLPKER